MRLNRILTFRPGKESPYFQRRICANEWCALNIIDQNVYASPVFCSERVSVLTYTLHDPGYLSQ
jgi:hypothetical protein